MGVLYARVGGAWVPVLGVNEVAIGTDPPTDPDVELWYDTDDPGSGLVGVESGTYTPTLSGCAIGTGGSATNTAQYAFVGGVGVGAMGIMYVSGLVTFGTTGATVPQSNPILSLPPGFNLVVAVTNRVMTAMTTAGGGFQMALIVLNSGDLNHVTIEPTVISGNIIGPTGMGPTTPAAWAAGNSIRWNVTMQAVRV